MHSNKFPNLTPEIVDMRLGNRPLKCLHHASVKTMNRNAMWETWGKIHLYLHAWNTRMT